MKFVVVSEKVKRASQPYGAEITQQSGLVTAEIYHTGPPPNLEHSLRVSGLV